MASTSTHPGYALFHSYTFPTGPEPRQRAAPPASLVASPALAPQPSQRLPERVNETVPSPNIDLRAGEAAAVLAQASPTAATETTNPGGRQWPTGPSPANGYEVPIVMHFTLYLPPKNNPHCTLPHINHNEGTTQTLTLAPQTANSVGDRTPTAQSPRPYQDDIDLRSPTESTASEMSELDWPIGPS